EVVLAADTQYIRPDFRDDLESYHLQTGDILFNNTNSVELVGKTAIVREPMAVAFSNHINRLRVRDPNQIDPRWLALALRNLRDQGFFASHCNKWIGQAGFSVSELAKVDIPIPYPNTPARSLETQRRIVARIEALFEELRECRKLHQAVVEDTNRLMEAVLAEIFGQIGKYASATKTIESRDNRYQRRNTSPLPDGLLRWNDPLGEDRRTERQYDHGHGGIHYRTGSEGK
ncbi:restriction endonuclease subunit S, partial [Candidatus Amarolinea dominans]|uniref:restriction endonuclease subunit S n=1 Tax=Candidatus Amarolinea dominans TaxID=3140696 RepID=UPI003135B173|nr:restriction endonuclease subunit S [Anaerolineae bacterium]